MMTTRIIPLAAICLVSLAAGPAPAQVKVDKMLEDLEAEKARFVKEKQAAKQKVLSRFDTLIRKVNDSNVKAADKPALARRLRAEREEFAKTEDLPENTDVVPLGWEYGRTVVQRYRPLSNKFDQVINVCLRDGNPARAEQVRADKEKFDDEHFPGRKQFVAGAVFEGSRYTGLSATRFRVRVMELDGGVFKAHAEQDIRRAGHPEFDISGSLDGIHVTCGGMKNTEGSARLAKCEGVVLGETLILELVAGNGRPGHAVLRKKH
jgi:hypothetical protein